jgi:hypothetical protein
VRDLLALEQVQLEVEEQVGQHGRVALAPVHPRDRSVDDRQRCAHAGQTVSA